MPGHRFLTLLAVLAALSSAGCSVVTQTDSVQCKVDADCEQRGFAGAVCADSVCAPKPDPKWGCIGHVAPVKGGSMVTVKTSVVDALTMKPITTLQAKLCSKYDTQCMSPVNPDVKVDAMGSLSVTIPSDFQGYFDVTAPTYVENLVFIDVVNMPKNPEIQTVQTPIVMALALQAGVPLDPELGVVLIRTVDCQQDRTAGVSLSIFPSSKETGFYFIQNGASPTASATDEAGNGGFLNIAPGTPTITATLGPGGKEIGKVTTLIRKGAITEQIVGPTSTL